MLKNRNFGVAIMYNIVITLYTYIATTNYKYLKYKSEGWNDE